MEKDNEAKCEVEIFVDELNSPSTSSEDSLKKRIRALRYDKTHLQSLNAALRLELHRSRSENGALQRQVEQSRREIVGLRAQLSRRIVRPSSIPRAVSEKSPIQTITLTVRLRRFLAGIARRMGWGRRRGGTTA
jgi:hypothetical protein